MNNVIKTEKKAQEPAGFGSVVDQIFQNNLSRFFDDEFWGFNGFSKTSGRSQVPVNICETDGEYEMDLYAPGFKKQDFHLNLEGDMFTISGEAGEANKTTGKNGNWVRQEFRRQSFSRSFALDDTIDREKIGAMYEDGILHLSFPKKEHAQKLTRTISVQ